MHVKDMISSDLSILASQLHAIVLSIASLYYK